RGRGGGATGLPAAAPGGPARRALRGAPRGDGSRRGPLRDQRARLATARVRGGGAGMKGLLLAILAGTGCTEIIHPPPPDGGGGTGGVVAGGSGGAGGGGPIGHVQLLWQFNLPRTAVNLAPSYGRFHDGLIGALTEQHIAVDQTGVAPQYGPAQLLWGSSE